MPQVVFIDGNITEDVNGNDEHPPGDIQTGQKFVSDRVHDLMASPQWKDLALFITWDEHGGTFDHVVPPTACAPDGVAPILTNAADKAVTGGFNQYGVRVPFITVSPYAKRGYVSHRLYDHTSITRFIETKFKLPALSWRDANADPLLDLFDFRNPPFVQPPTIAVPTVNADQMAQCQTLFVQQNNGEEGGGGG